MGKDQSKMESLLSDSTEDDLLQHISQSDEKELDLSEKIHDAISKNNIHRCFEIIESGFDPNKTLRVNVGHGREHRLIPRDLHPTPLHIACIYRRPEIVEILCRHGANTNLPDRLGRPPLMLTLLYWPRLLYIENDPTMTREENDYQMYLKRLHNKCLKTLQILCSHGADSNIPIEDGRRSLLHLAARYNIPLALSALLENGARLDAPDSDGNSALIIAAQWNNHESCAALIDHGASVNTRSKTSRTPLHYLCNANNADSYDTVTLFLKHNADVNARDDLGNTPLHLASSGGRERLIDTLLNRGASAGLRNLAGHTPLFVFLDRAANEKKRYGLQRLLDDTLQVSVVDEMGSVPLLLRHPSFQGLRRYLLFSSFNVPSLQRTCRHVIRRAIGLDKLSHDSISRLPGPRRIHDMILLNPVVDCSVESPEPSYG